MSERIGLDAKIYRNTGTYGTPVWNEITKARDVTLNLTRGEADAKSRASQWAYILATFIEGSIDYELLYDTAVDDWAALRDAFLNRTPIEFAIMDGDIATAGSQGLRATCQVLNFTRNEPLEDALTASVSIKPTPAANEPSWYTVP